ncbi:uncharacterized protein LOC111313658 [Durio zibethinus]|uniref:Uncharacterized protein LOC111313658 n=1 Tax=Durio zibethinus TaxID=66656 RepID=A0A6P6AZ50_DURZI|nr:uncharacterized protein LOC111313658 [Durio zibethinus]
MDLNFEPPLIPNIAHGFTGRARILNQLLFNISNQILTLVITNGLYWYTVGRVVLDCSKSKLSLLKSINSSASLPLPPPNTLPLSFSFLSTFTSLHIANQQRGSPKSIAVMSAYYYSGCPDYYEARYPDACSLCRKSLHNSDIFMYRGNTPFCSTECRQEQMEIDEKKWKSGRSLRNSDAKSSAPNKTVRTSAVAVA